MENTKFVVAAGCSFTEYPQHEARQNWPGHLSKYLNCEPISIFLGRSSADNSYIANTVLHTLSKIDKSLYKDILVGVMWSGASRTSFYLKDIPEDFSHYPHNYNPTGFLASNYYLVNANWTDNLAQIYYKTFYDEVGSLIKSLKNMLLVQNFLKLNNIKYFFTEYSYDCTTASKHIDDPDAKFLSDLLDKNHFLPVKHMSHYIDNHTDLKYDPFDNHPTTEMSKEFTYKVIIPHLKNMGYIS